MISSLRKQAYNLAYYKKHRQESIDRANRRRDEIRSKIIAYKRSHPCKCGESHPAALDFHHANGNKEFTVSRAYSDCYSWKRIEKEISKCEMICRNCHAKLHWHTNI